MDCHWYRNSLYSHFLYWNKGTSRTPSKKDQHTHGSSGMKQHKISIALSSTTSHLSKPLAMDDSQPRFLSQESVVFARFENEISMNTTLFHCNACYFALKIAVANPSCYKITFNPVLYGLFLQIMTLMFLQGLPDMYVSIQERIISLNSHWYSWELKPWFAVFVRPPIAFTSTPQLYLILVDSN